MTITVELTDDVVQAIERKAGRLGITASEYMSSIAEKAARPTCTASKRKEIKQKTGAEILAAIKALNLPPGYGDPTTDSPELARQLAARFSRPNREQAQ